MPSIYQHIFPDLLLPLPFLLLYEVEKGKEHRGGDFFLKAWSEETLARSGIFTVLLGIVSYRAVEK